MVSLGTGCRRRRGDALLHAIFAAVVAELADVGYAGLSIERVAERAGTGKASIYRRWPQRLDLVVDALDHALPAYEDPPDTGSVREDLLVVLGRVAAAMNGPAGRAARACFGQLESEPELGRALRERLMPPRKAMILDVLRRGAQRGEVREQAVTERVASVGPMLLQSELIHHGSPLSAETVVGVVDEVIMPLLRPVTHSNDGNLRLD